jgi:hypothetical protein
MKITALEESVDFATLDPEKLFSKLKSHELFRKSRLNHDVSHFSKALISSARVGGHDANPTNTIDSSTFEFALSSLTVASDEQYKSISNDEIALLARKLCVLHMFHKVLWVRQHHPLHRRLPQAEEARLLLQHVQLQQPERLHRQGEGKKKYRFGDKKKKFQKMMSWACVVLSDFDFSSDDSLSSDEDDKPKRKTDDFTGLFLMGKSSRHISDSDVSDDLSPEHHSFWVAELEMLCATKTSCFTRFFTKTKSWILSLKMFFQSCFS